MASARRWSRTDKDRLRGYCVYIYVCIYIYQINLNRAVLVWGGVSLGGILIIIGSSDTFRTARRFRRGEGAWGVEFANPNPEG